MTGLYKIVRKCDIKAVICVFIGITYTLSNQLYFNPVLLKNKGL